MKHLDIEKYKNYSDFEIEGYHSLYKDIYSEFESVSPEKYNLKLLLISDTHGSLEYDYDFKLFVKNNNYDLCILLGDINGSDLKTILRFIKVEDIIAIHGNNYPLELYNLFSINDIDNKVIDYNGVKISGISGSFGSRTNKYTFYSQYNNLKDMNTLASSDILITHDATFKNNSYRVGLIGIDYYLVKNKVNYHFHGHLHNSYENIYPNGTKEVCVYKYRIINI